MAITEIGSNYNNTVQVGEALPDISGQKYMNRVNKGEKVNLFHENPNGVSVELSEEGLKKLSEDALSVKEDGKNNLSGSYEERVKFLQEALEPTQELYRIVPGSDLRSKYGYISRGELMKENDPEAYDRYDKMITEAFEKHDKDLLLQAAKDMIDWMSDFEKDAPIFANFVKFAERV